MATQDRPGPGTQPESDTPATDDGPKSRISRRIVLGLLMLLAVVGVVAVVIVRSRPSTHTIRGTITLNGPFLRVGRSQCAGDKEDADVRGGAAVTVTSDAGKRLGSGSLVPGSLVTTADGASRCGFLFVVRDVKDADSYQVEIAGHTGPRRLKADLVAKGWTLDATLG